MAKSILILDFDRVLYDTPKLISFVRRKCDQAGVCDEETYRSVYTSWSGRARATRDVSKLPVAEQQRLVSWTQGFVPELAAEITRGHPVDRERVQNGLLHIHEKGLSEPFVYPHARDLVTLLPKDRVFMFSAGGLFDQHKKIQATGFSELFDPSHIAVIPAKTTEEFMQVLQTWGIDHSNRIIHVNDRLGELVELERVHPNPDNVSVLAGWSYEPGKIPEAPETIHVAPTIESCITFMKETLGGNAESTASRSKESFTR